GQGGVDHPRRDLAQRDQRAAAALLVVQLVQQLAVAVEDLGRLEHLPRRELGGGRQVARDLREGLRHDADGAEHDEDAGGGQAWGAGGGGGGGGAAAGTGTSVSAPSHVPCGRGSGMAARPTAVLLAPCCPRSLGSLEEPGYWV